MHLRVGPPGPQPYYLIGRDLPWIYILSLYFIGVIG
jgi:hypothetical protein